MYAARLQGREDTSVSTKIGRNWVHEDPREVAYRVVVPGMMCPVGWLKEFTLRPGQEAELPDKSTFQWSALEVESIRLSHPAHLMLIEGVAPAWLFLGAQIVGISNPDVCLKGPFAPLRLDGAPIHRVPYSLSNLVFGIPELPAGKKLPEIVTAMRFRFLSSPLA